MLQRFSDSSWQRCAPKGSADGETEGEMGSEALIKRKGKIENEYIFRGNSILCNLFIVPLCIWEKGGKEAMTKILCLIVFIAIFMFTLIYDDTKKD